MNTIKFSHKANEQLSELEGNPSKKAAYKAISKCLGYMKTNLRHNSLQTHKFTSKKGPKGEKIFESYAQQETPGAHRIFWYYGPGRMELTISAIIPHP
ncbi:MAG: hypothetical protein QG657_1745 [Acidobacteriota bacterium]|nr:hypothetical protein [Acidobacteriota bacterium]